MKNVKVIKLALIKYRVSTADAAEYFGITTQKVRNQSNSNNPTMNTIKAYAELFGIKPSELIALGE